jgi:hypothetical protein
MIAASAAIDSSEADRLDDLGEELKEAITALGSQYGLAGGAKSSVSRQRTGRNTGRIRARNQASLPRPRVTQPVRSSRTRH